MLLSAQPVSRIVRLAIDDITDDGATVTVRQGEPPSPLPKPAADLIRQLVLQAPAPIIAKALGCHDNTTTRLVTEAGGSRSRCAPGDRTR